MNNKLRNGFIVGLLKSIMIGVAIGLIIGTIGYKLLDIKYEKEQQHRLEEAVLHIETKVEDVDVDSIINKYWVDVIKEFPEANYYDSIEGNVIIFPTTGVVVYYPYFGNMKVDEVYQVEYSIATEDVLSVKKIK